MIFSVGSAEVTAEMTSVRQFFTFSVMPSLSIMIIYRTAPYIYTWRRQHVLHGCLTRDGTHVGAGVEERLRAVDEPLRVARAGGLELRDGGVAACAPPAYILCACR